MKYRRIPSLLIIVFLLGTSHTLWAQQPVLVSPQWLHDHLGDPQMVILHTGFLVRASR